MEKKYVIGIDLGGTKISCALADLKGKIISKNIVPTNASEGEQAVLDRIITNVDTVIKSSNKNIEAIRAIGIGSPGPLDAYKGIIIKSPNLPFKDFNLKGEIAERFGIETFLENDGNTAAVGEFLFGAGKGTKNMVYVTVSTGIGGGAIINGKLYRGATSNALEIGHITVAPDGPKCGCGNYGCAEAMASGTAIAREAREAVYRGLDTALNKYEIITAYEVFKEAEKKDAIASFILEKSLTYLGICIANVICCFDPEKVIIGGGVSNGGKIVFDRVKEIVLNRVIKPMNTCEIVSAGLGNDAGVMGAIALAITESE